MADQPSSPDFHPTASTADRMTLPFHSFAGFCSDAITTHAGGRAGYTVMQAGGDAGLFLCVAAALLAASDAPPRLHYLFLVPQLPTPEQMQQCLSETPALVPPLPLQPLVDELCSGWPPSVPGYHRLLLQQGRVILTLVVGDIGASLVQLDARIDCIVLGESAFSTAPLLKRLGRLAAPQAQLLLQGNRTASPAELAQAGFQADIAGAGERQMPDEVPVFSSMRFAPRWEVASLAAKKARQRSAIIIGAGLAGCAACERLTARGWDVTLIERHGGAAQEASGNLAGVVMPAISSDDNPTARLTRAAFLFAQQVWKRLGVFDDGARIGRICGVLQVARDPVQAAAFEQAARHWQYPPDYAQWLTAQEASARLGMTTGSGWFFPRGGWMRPGALCEAMLAACGEHLQRRFSRQALTLTYVEGQWHAADASGVIARAPVVILANGVQAPDVAQAATLPLEAIRGQVSHVSASLLPRLPFALCGDGYLTGPVDGVVSLGASYDRDKELAPRLASHEDNLARLRHLLPTLSVDIDPAQLEGRVGFRCVSADRLPLAGALPDIGALAGDAELQLRTMPRWPHCFGLLGYASRGLIWAPLAAEIVACTLEGEPAPLGKDLLALLDPARFALKAHRRAAGQG